MTNRSAGLFLNQKFIAVQTCDPARRLATAGPRAATVGVAIFRCDACARTTGFSALCRTAATEFRQRNAVVGHFLLDLIQHFRVFTRLRFFDLLFELLALSE